MDKELDALAFSLFKLFAQYEYALKALGYCKVGPKNQVEPDWDMFANTLGKAVFELESPEISEALNYILDQPPKRQTLIEGHIDWEIVSNQDRSTQALFGHIRRVRNNLYHGGKFNGRWFEPDRSRDLIGRTLVILEALKLDHPMLSGVIAGNAV